MKIFAKIRFFIKAFTIYLVAGGVMVPLMLIFKDRSYILHRYNAIIMKLIGGRIERHGERDGSADLFVLNHQGVIDIIALEADENSNIRWIAKKELFELPWLGNLLKLPEMISVDRENKAGLVKLLKDAKALKESEPPHKIMAIFPEGTRNPKQRLRKFKSGTKLLAEKLNLKIQPIVITNSKKLLNEHELTAESTTVHITYLDSFTPDRRDREWFKRLQEQMQEVIDREASLGRYR
ncbi:MAG: 1-acyl-sn-glycerol-3-phosphate acyltransferase [Epsilonproteobacteria bacterium]|nr:1-acyl-sn-glycerol-3-phosphate acyltransferase [Campylobacterota bacterium]